MWDLLPVQCEELRIKHLTLLLVLTMPYACWVLCRGDYIEDFEWCLHFQFRVVFWRVVVREVYFEGHWRLQSCTLWPLHTRDWEPMIIALWALSLVEKAELVQVRLTLCFKDHWSMWVQDGCVKSTWIPTWRWMDHVSWSIRIFSKTTSWR